MYNAKSILMDKKLERVSLTQSLIYNVDGEHHIKYCIIEDQKDGIILSLKPIDPTIERKLPHMSTSSSIVPQHF